MRGNGVCPKLALDVLPRRSAIELLVVRIEAPLGAANSDNAEAASCFDNATYVFADSALLSERTCTVTRMD